MFYLGVVSYSQDVSMQKLALIFSASWTKLSHDCFFGMFFSNRFLETYHADSNVQTVFFVICQIQLRGLWKAIGAMFGLGIARAFELLKDANSVGGKNGQMISIGPNGP